MSLPARQQAVLNQIERLLAASDPRLKATFASFGRMVQHQAMPVTEVIGGWTARRLVTLVVLVLGIAGVLVFGIRSSSNDCPGPRSGPVVATAAVRYAGCTGSASVWSRGTR